MPAHEIRGQNEVTARTNDRWGGTHHRRGTAGLAPCHRSRDGFGLRLARVTCRAQSLTVVRVIASAEVQGNDMVDFVNGIEEDVALRAAPRASSRDDALLLVGEATFRRSR